MEGLHKSTLLICAKYLSHGIGVFFVAYVQFSYYIRVTMSAEVGCKFSRYLLPALQSLRLKSFCPATKLMTIPHSHFQVRYKVKCKTPKFLTEAYLWHKDFTFLLFASSHTNIFFLVSPCYLS